MSSAHHCHCSTKTEFCFRICICLKEHCTKVSGRISNKSWNERNIWFLSGDFLTWALHVLWLQLSPPLPSFLASIKSANPGSPRKWPLEQREKVGISKVFRVCQKNLMTPVYLIAVQRMANDEMCVLRRMWILLYDLMCSYTHISQYLKFQWILNSSVIGHIIHDLFRATHPRKTTWLFGC